MNDKQSEQLINYMNKIIENNRLIIKNLHPHLSNHNKIKKALGWQIGASKSIIKIVSQFTFDFDDINLFK